MAKAVLTRGVDLEPIDRLRGENTRALQENERLVRELDAMRSRIAEAEGAGSELTALREERELVRSRVGEMLQQLEALEL